MIIGVDADGVLTDMQEFNYTYGKLYFKKEIVNPNGYSVKEIFNKGPLGELMYGLKYLPKYCKEWSPRENAVEIIAKLNRDGHELHEITARKFVTFKNFIGKWSRETFEQWLKENGLEFNSIQYCSESNTPKDKLLACKKLNVDVMIDDKRDVALHLAENGIPVILFDAPYNQGLEHKNIRRVKSWAEIYEVIVSGKEFLKESVKTNSENTKKA